MRSVRIETLLVRWIHTCLSDLVDNSELSKATAPLTDVHLLTRQNSCIEPPTQIEAQDQQKAK